MKKSNVNSTVEYVFANDRWSDQCESLQIFDVHDAFGNKILWWKTWIDDGHSGDNMMFFLIVDGDEIYIKCWDFIRYRTEFSGKKKGDVIQEKFLDHFKILEAQRKTSKEFRKHHKDREEYEHESLSSFRKFIELRSIDDDPTYSKETLAKVRTYIYYHIYGEKKAKEFVKKFSKRKGISKDLVNELNELAAKGTVKREKHFGALNMLRNLKELSENVMKDSPKNNNHLKGVEELIKKLEEDND